MKNSKIIDIKAVTIEHQKTSHELSWNIEQAKKNSKASSAIKSFTNSFIFCVSIT